MKVAPAAPTARRESSARPVGVGVYLCQLVERACEPGRATSSYNCVTRCVARWSSPRHIDLVLDDPKSSAERSAPTSSGSPSARLTPIRVAERRPHPIRGLRHSEQRRCATASTGGGRASVAVAVTAPASTVDAGARRRAVRRRRATSGDDRQRQTSATPTVTRALHRGQRYRDRIEPAGFRAWANRPPALALKVADRRALCVPPERRSRPAGTEQPTIQARFVRLGGLQHPANGLERRRQSGLSPHRAGAHARARARRAGGWVAANRHRSACASGTWRAAVR